MPVVDGRSDEIAVLRFSSLATTCAAIEIETALEASDNFTALRAEWTEMTTRNFVGPVRDRGGHPDVAGGDGS